MSYQIVPLIPEQSQGQIGLPGPARAGFSRFWQGVQVAATYGIYPDSSGSGDITLNHFAVSPLEGVITSDTFGDQSWFFVHEFATANQDTTIDSIERQVDLFLGLTQGTAQDVPDGGGCWGCTGRFVRSDPDDIDTDVALLKSYASVMSSSGSMAIIAFPPNNVLLPDVGYANCFYEENEIVVSPTEPASGGQYKAEYKMAVRQAPA